MTDELVVFRGSIPEILRKLADHVESDGAPDHITRKWKISSDIQLKCIFPKKDFFEEELNGNQYTMEDHMNNEDLCVVSIDVCFDSGGPVLGIRPSNI